MMEVSISTIAQLVSAGGVLAYATLVYLQLKTQGQRMDKHEEKETELLADVKVLLTLLLERDRGRAGPTPPFGVIPGGRTPTEPGA